MNKINKMNEFETLGFYKNYLITEFKKKMKFLT